jgi:RNA polymerase sigma factor (sigma-70 family)
MAAVLDFPSRADSLGVLYTRFSAPLRRFFRGYRLNSADVDDLTQDVFVRLAGPSAQTELLKPDAFVFTLARNLVRDRARRLHIKALPKSVAVDTLNLCCGRPTPDQCLELEQHLRSVEERLNGLKPSTRKAFLMHRVHGESHAEIATHMGISVSMVEKHIMETIVALRDVNA